MTLETARRVIEMEAESLGSLAESLDDGFLALLDLLSAATGRLVVTGMGKSGHIARKIAATIASTGTPAHFVHPAEASHGDLGMITSEDALLALSNSGETKELQDMIAYSRRYKVPLTAVTSGANSTLAEAADAAVILPKAPEACPMGLAPTTSTTMMLALGDAIAICLLERKGFSAADFRVLHPGGSLGQQLLKVSDIMHGSDEMPVCRGTTPVSEAILIMTNRAFGCVGILDKKGHLVGIVTDGDLRRHMADGLLDLKAAEIMTASPRTISASALAVEALGEMHGRERQRPVTALFVTEGEKPVGIIHIHDCLRVGIA
jgi:arabinose-5-phosphate isomerase